MGEGNNEKDALRYRYIKEMLLSGSLKIHGAALNSQDVNQWDEIIDSLMTVPEKTRYQQGQVVRYSSLCPQLPLWPRQAKTHSCTVEKAWNHLGDTKYVIRLEHNNHQGEALEDQLIGMSVNEPLPAWVSSVTYKHRIIRLELSGASDSGSIIRELESIVKIPTFDIHLDGVLVTGHSGLSFFVKRKRRVAYSMQGKVVARNQVVEVLTSWFTEKKQK